MNYDNRITPEEIQTLDKNEVFVFGSNLAGRHGLGAAKQATIWGALYGKAFGPQGKTYAIPTKDKEVSEKLPIDVIKRYVNRFIEYARQNKKVTFLVTPIGCGLAGYRPSEIAPLFKEAVNLENVKLPLSFWKVLNE